MRLTIVQYAGNYGEAWKRLRGGGGETYQAQRYSVEFVSGLTAIAETVSVICALGDAAEDEILDNGVRSICAGFAPGFDPSALIPHIERTAPDRLIVTTPMRPLFAWGLRQGIRMLAPLADSFDQPDIRSRIRHWRLSRLLNAPGIEWVGNHGINACLSLADIGVRPAKIVPWDWPHPQGPRDFEPKQTPPGGVLNLIYVGMISASKGVGDLLDALALLRRDGMDVRLSLAGRDATGEMAAKATTLGLDDAANFLGLIPNDQVRPVMREADIVIVPSRHEYPEGLPLTIYEALSSRTPIVASDHPMFRGVLTDEVSAMIFPAASPQALANKIRRLADDPALYAQLSENAVAAWDAIQLPLLWGDLVERWLADDAGLGDQALASGVYDAQLMARGRNRFN